ncbi:e1-E2 ATPase [Bacteroides intestinalis]|uniref:E1-E2 ATPase n=1 Tax=Bacteroides intestinalis TaxID=329854 RepID=A0A139KM51_9BACE|nr:e1-E2 ATPase [Bacteroides intestinalis]
MKWKKKLQQPQYALNSEKVFLTATQPAKSVYSYLQTTRLGLTRAEVEDRQLTYGKNEVVHEQKKNPFIVFIKTFINPFIGVLTGLAVISLVIDVLMAEPGEQEWTGVVIIAVMVVCSAILRFWQEWKANEATDSLMKMVKNTCLVKRTGSGEEELDITELVPGDIVFLAAGDMIPADLRIIESKDLFISQASLTGESEPIEKFPEVKEKQYRKGSIVELDNICYMGSTVIFRQGNQQSKPAAHPFYAGHGSVRILHQRVYERGLVRGFHLRHFGSRRTYARDASDDCNRQPL